MLKELNIPIALGTMINAHHRLEESIDDDKIIKKIVIM